MNAATRWWEVTRREFSAAFRRPAHWVLLAVLALMALGLAEGAVTVSSGSFVPGAEVTGPFHPWNYLFPTLLFEVPQIRLFGVAVPEYEFEDVTKTLEPRGAQGAGTDTWVVRGTVRHIGTGHMTVEMAAMAGGRWSDEGDDVRRAVVAADYRDARTEATLGAGESAEFEIRAGFDPERALVDPDVLVLQLNRDDAVFDF